MAAVYARAVMDGRRTLDSVPERWRAAVALALLEAQAEDEQVQDDEQE